MEDNNVYLYKKGGVELATPSLRLAVIRSQDSRILAIKPDGEIVEVITK